MLISQTLHPKVSLCRRQPSQRPPHRFVSVPSVAHCLTRNWTSSYAPYFYMFMLLDCMIFSHSASRTDNYHSFSLSLSFWKEELKPPFSRSAFWTFSLCSLRVSSRVCSLRGSQWARRKQIFFTLLSWTEQKCLIRVLKE